MSPQSVLGSDLALTYPFYLAAAVDRDREVQQDLVSGRQLVFQPGEHIGRSGGRGEEPCLHLGRRRQLDEILLERPREAAAAEIPAVELLQKADRALLAELADGLTDEQDQLGGDLLAAGLSGVVLDDLAQRP